MYFKFGFIFLERCHLKRLYSTPGYELGKNNYTRGELVAVKKPEVTFPKPQSNRFTVGQAIYVVRPETKMKTSTAIGSSLLIACNGLAGLIHRHR